MTRQLLIDADFTLFQACSAVERESVFENEAEANYDTLEVMER